MDILTSFIATNLKAQDLTLTCFKTVVRENHYVVTALVEESKEPLEFLILKRTIDKMQ